MIYFKKRREKISNIRQYTWETISKVIQSEVKTIQVELQRQLGENLLGMYLHGSLALGDFHPARSDIDMVVMTEQELDLETKRVIMSFLLRVSRMPCPLDTRFLVEASLFPFQQPLPCALHYNETRREQYQEELRNGTWKHWNDALQYDPALVIVLAVLHQQGICLYGKPIAAAFPVVPEHILQAALVKDVQDALKDPLHDLISCVLNACRVLAYLNDGMLRSKDAGGTWGLAHVPEQYHALIQQALALSQGERPGRPVGPTAVAAFATYVQETLP
jgi:predicted nucleotidyltransferase